MSSFIFKKILKPDDLVERMNTLDTILKSESKKNLSEAQKPSDKNRVRN